MASAAHPIHRASQSASDDSAYAAQPRGSLFDADQIALFREGFPDSAVKFRHKLCDHPLLEEGALQRLAAHYPEQHQEFTSGDIEFSQPDADKIPRTGLSFQKTVETVEAIKAWACFRSIQCTPDYARLLDAVVDALGPAALLPDGRTHMHDGFIFVTSPDCNTPFHFDPEYNVLMQIRGEKTVCVFPANDPDILSAVDHEDLHAFGKTNIVYDEKRFLEKGTVFHLTPGDALYMPVKAPHWVINGGSTSTSFSATWRSSATDYNRRVHLMNRRLRLWGATPPPFGAAPMRDRVKAELYRIAEKLGA